MDNVTTADRIRIVEDRMDALRARNTGQQRMTDAQIDAWRILARRAKALRKQLREEKTN